MAHKFKLGNKIRDMVSGLEGITTGRIEYLNGCVQYNIHPEAKDGDSKQDKICYYDEQQLELVDEGIAGKVKPIGKTEEGHSNTGGAPSTVRSAR